MKHSDPYIHDDFDKAFEFFRLATSLLSKYNIALSPLNFRLGYDYVAGRNVELIQAFDHITEDTDSVTAARLWHLYQQFFIQNEAALEKIRKELRDIILQIQKAFERSGGDLSSYSKTLGRFAEILGSSMPLQAIQSELHNLIDETRTMEQNQHRLESDMAHLLVEMETLRKDLEQVKQESITDSLTGIANRKAFDAALDHAVIAAREQNSPISLLIIDIDHFKQFNYTYGHLVGDKVLRFVGSTLKLCLKGKDIPARFGGEEFSVILPKTTLAGAEIVAEQIRREVSTDSLKAKNKGQRYGGISVSIGIAQFRINELPYDLIKRADEALYLAKKRGRNRIEKAV